MNNHLVAIIRDYADRVEALGYGVLLGLGEQLRAAKSAPELLAVALVAEETVGDLATVGHAFKERAYHMRRLTDAATRSEDEYQAYVDTLRLIGVVYP